jgi:hypothetical protein
LTRAIGAFGAVLLVSPAAVAADDLLTPERRALLDPANHPAAVLQQQDAWHASAVRDGPVAGLPGNRHVVNLAVYRSTTDPDEIEPRIGVSLLSSQCTDSGTCTQQLQIEGTTLRPPGLVATPDGPASAHLVIDTSTPSYRVTNPSGFPVAPFPVDLTITPDGPPLGTGVTLGNADSITHRRAADDPSTYLARRLQRRGEATVTGTAFGVTFSAGDRGSVTRWEQLAEELPPTAPVRTAAERRPLLPPVTGTGVASGLVQVEATGVLGRQPATSSGRTFPGDRTAVDVTLVAETGSSELVAVSRSYRCPAPAAEYEECTLLDGVRLTPRGTTRLVTGADGRLAATRAFAVAPEPVADDDPGAWGTIRLAVAAAPGGNGALDAGIRFQRDGVTAELSGSTELRYATSPGDTARAPVFVATLGTALMLPPARVPEQARLTYRLPWGGVIPAP